MYRPVLSILSVVMLLVLNSSTVCASESGNNTDKVDTKRKQLLTQKLFLLDNILLRSASTKKMRLSDNSEVVELVSLAEEKASAARNNLDNGKLVEGGKNADEALRVLTSASSIVAQVQRSTLLQRSRFQELMAGLEALTKDRSPYSDDKVSKLIVRAKDAAASDDYKSANQLLSAALDLKAIEAAGRYDTDTIVYSLTFDTPAEEYQYEIRQYESNLLLLKLVLENNNSGTTKKLVEKYIAEANQINVDANDQSTRGKFEKAVKTMEDANKKLAQALGYLGVRYK